MKYVIVIYNELGPLSVFGPFSGEHARIFAEGLNVKKVSGQNAVAMFLTEVRGASR